MTIRRFAGIAAILVLPMGCCCPPMMMCGPPGPPGYYAPVSPIGRFPGPSRRTASIPMTGYDSVGSYAAAAPQAPPVAAGLPRLRRRLASSWPITASYQTDRDADRKLKRQNRVQQCSCEKCRRKGQRSGQSYIPSDMYYSDGGSCECGTTCDDGGMYDGFASSGCSSCGCDTGDYSSTSYAGDAYINDGYTAAAHSSGCPCESGGSNVQYYDQSVDGGMSASEHVLMPQPVQQNAVPRPVPPPAPPETPPMDDRGSLDPQARSTVQPMGLSIPTIDFNSLSQRSSDIELVSDQRIVEVTRPVELRMPASDAELIDETFEQVTIPPTAVTRKRIER